MVRIAEHSLFFWQSDNFNFIILDIFQNFGLRYNFSGLSSSSKTIIGKGSKKEAPINLSTCTNEGSIRHMYLLQVKRGKASGLLQHLEVLAGKSVTRSLTPSKGELQIRYERN